MNYKFIALTLLLVSAVCVQAQSYDIDMTAPQQDYNEATGRGYDLGTTWDGRSIHPFYYSVRVPDGNYLITVTLGSRRRNAATVVRAEARRLMLDEVITKRKQYRTYSFVVNKHSTRITDTEQVQLKSDEVGTLNWDDKLTLEFNGAAPAVERIQIRPDTTATTIFLCGNSTVVDQPHEPYTSWGQMVPVWFDSHVAIANFAASGLTAGSFLSMNRLDKIVSLMRPGDYVLCEFGHNDQKETAPGSGAWYNFSYNLKRFIDVVRAHGGTIVFVTPTQRRRFDDTYKHIVESHGLYPDAMRAVARRENVPLIELHNMTRTFFEALGYENSKKSLVHYPAGTFPNQPNALADNTHFNPYGAYEISKMAVMGMKELRLPIIKYLRPEWKDYDPAHPDDFNTYKWYQSAQVDTSKPDGN